MFGAVLSAGGRRAARPAPLPGADRRQLGALRRAAGLQQLRVLRLLRLPDPRQGRPGGVAAPGAAHRPVRAPARGLRHRRRCSTRTGRRATGVRYLDADRRGPRGAGRPRGPGRRRLRDAPPAAAQRPGQLVGPGRPQPHVPLPDVHGRRLPVLAARRAGPGGHPPHDDPIVPGAGRATRPPAPPGCRGSGAARSSTAASTLPIQEALNYPPGRPAQPVDAGLGAAGPAVGLHHAGRGPAPAREPDRPRPDGPRRLGLPRRPGHLRPAPPRAGGLGPLRRRSSRRCMLDAGAEWSFSSTSPPTARSTPTLEHPLGLAPGVQARHGHLPDGRRPGHQRGRARGPVPRRREPARAPTRRCSSPPRATTRRSRSWPSPTGPRPCSTAPRRRPTEPSAQGSQAPPDSIGVQRTESRPWKAADGPSWAPRRTLAWLVATAAAAAFGLVAVFASGDHLAVVVDDLGTTSAAAVAAVACLVAARPVPERRGADAAGTSSAWPAPRGRPATPSGPATSWCSHQDAPFPSPGRRGLPRLRAAGRRRRRPPRTVLRQRRARSSASLDVAPDHRRAGRRRLDRRPRPGGREHRGLAGAGRSRWPTPSATS